MPPGRDGDAGAVANLARIQILAGERTAGEANLQLLLDRDARGEHVVSYQIAAVYEALGNRVETFSLAGPIHRRSRRAGQLAALAAA